VILQNREAVMTKKSYFRKNKGDTWVAASGDTNPSDATDAGKEAGIVTVLTCRNTARHLEIKVESRRLYQEKYLSKEQNYVPSARWHVDGCGLAKFDNTRDRCNDHLRLLRSDVVSCRIPLATRSIGHYPPIWGPPAVSRDIPSLTTTIT